MGYQRKYFFWGLMLLAQLGAFLLFKDLADLSQRARDGKLKPVEMQGGCFSISSLDSGSKAAGFQTPKDDDKGQKAVSK